MHNCLLLICRAMVHIDLSHDNAGFVAGKEEACGPIVISYQLPPVLNNYFIA